MPSSDYASIGSLTEFLDELVLGINDKVGIEGCKGVSLHGGLAGSDGLLILGMIYTKWWYETRCSYYRMQAAVSYRVQIRMRGSPN
jgi:hypothetical protein